MTRDAGPEVIQAVVLVARDWWRKRPMLSFDARFAGQVVVRRRALTVATAGAGALMTDRRLVAGLDLGSTKTCAVIAGSRVICRARCSPRLPASDSRTAGAPRHGARHRRDDLSVAAALKDAERMAVHGSPT
jgi:hypothetical protein